MRMILPRMAALLAVSSLSDPAFAQDIFAPAATAVSAPAPSTSAMVNLVRALVAKGTLSPTEGQALLGQAEAEAARAQAATASAPPPGTVRVPYVPESVRAQIRDELKEDVLQTAKAEGWAQPGKVQDWVGKIKLYGDFRYRSEFQYYGRGNANNIFDFAVINASGPTELNPNITSFAPPFLNTTRDRNNRQSIRLRFGLLADINDKVSLDVRLATGDNASPVSTNSTLGGGFAKKNIWVDRAAVTLRPLQEIALTGGRMANPFTDTATTVYDDLLWDPDVNFDGVVAAVGSGDRFGEAFTLRAVGGAFPLEFGSANFPTAGTNKARAVNKWLYAAQLVGRYQFRHDIGIKASAAYYHFDGVQGRPSDPCQTYISGTECTTDPFRPAFLQKGNTVFLLRNIIGPPGIFNFSQRQFVGLTFDYRLIDLKTDVTVKLDEHKQVTVGGDYVKNLAFRRGDTCKAYPGGDPTLSAFRGPLNNLSDSAPACAAAGDNAGFQGGDTAWQAKVQVGWPSIRHFGEWNVIGGYKYIESDSMLDGLTDSDFHLGGTNAKGYFLAGTMGLFDGVAARARYLSANEVSGAPLAIDVLQLDLMVAF
jgi:hypothetical protein